MILFPHLFISSLASNRPLAVVPARYFPIMGYSAKPENAFCARRILHPVSSWTFSKSPDSPASSSHRSHSREFAVDQSSLAFQTFTSSGSSQTFHGSPHLFSASIYGSGSNSSTLNTPGFFHCPVTTIMEPIIAGTPVV